METAERISTRSGSFESLATPGRGSMVVRSSERRPSTMPSTKTKSGNLSLQGLMVIGLLPLISAIGFIDGPHPLHCPEKFYSLFEAVQMGASLYNEGQYSTAKNLLAEHIGNWANNDPLVGMECSLGIASAYRTLTFNYCANPRTNNRRAYQIGLRILHQAMNWITHVFVKSQHDSDMIDNSQWPITIQQINDELTIIQNVLKQNGIENGHQIHPRFAKDLIPIDYQPRNPDGSLRHKIGIISLCAYPDDHVLPRYAISNHRIYAERHNYNYYVETNRVDQDRPHAWGKIKLLEKYLSQENAEEDWFLWFDCDTYFMNMTVTIESVLYRYGAIPADEEGFSEEQKADFNSYVAVRGKNKIDSLDKLENEVILDPSVHLIIAEDNAMLNSGTFFIKKSEWSRDLMATIYGNNLTSPWVDHPWWENAALTWHFLKDVPLTFRSDFYTNQLESWPTLDNTRVIPDSVIQQNAGYLQPPVFNDLTQAEKDFWIANEMTNIYSSQVRIAPQHIFNSYHPVTSRFQHDTWEPGKYVLAFNGVLSSTSPTVIRILYGNYYREACRLNRIEHLCIEVVETLPWLQSHASLKKEIIKD